MQESFCSFFIFRKGYCFLKVYSSFDPSLSLLLIHFSCVMACSIYNHIQDFIQRLLGRTQRSQPSDHKHNRVTRKAQSLVSHCICECICTCVVAHRKIWWVISSRCTDSFTYHFLSWLCDAYAFSVRRKKTPHEVRSHSFWGFNRGEIMSLVQQRIVFHYIIPLTNKRKG